jgi:NADH:ubiquinone oxidoreductase subunit H
MFYVAEFCAFTISFISTLFLGGCQGPFADNTLLGLSPGSQNLPRYFVVISSGVAAASASTR